MKDQQLGDLAGDYDAMFELLRDNDWRQFVVARMLGISKRAIEGRVRAMRAQGYPIPKRSKSAPNNAKAPPVPTEEQIAERAAEIRAQWTEAEHYRRYQREKRVEFEFTEIGDGWMPGKGLPLA